MMTVKEKEEKENKKIRVCHVLTDTNVGGAGIALRNLLFFCDRERFAFSVVLPRGSAAIGMLAASGAEIIEADGIGDRSFAPRSVSVLARIFRSISPDVVHTHASMTGRLAARAAKVPAIVMTRHCAGETPHAATCGLIGALSGMLLRQTCTRAIAVGEEARRSLVAMHLPEDRIDVIYNGTPPPRNITEAEKNALRNELGIYPGDFVVGIFARLEKCKAHEVFLRAAALCVQNAPDMRFLIVGDGSRRVELEKLSHSLKLDSSVRFCGFREDTLPLMSLCEVNVNTSVPGEASSIAVIEGMSLGIPPVMSDCPDRGFLLDGCGLVSLPDSPESTADAIMRLKSDPSLLLRLSAAARKKYLERFTSDRCARETEAVYLKALADTSAKNPRRSYDS